MKRSLNCIMLVDDNPLDSFIHQRAIKKTGQSNIIITKNSGLEALEYLKSMNEPYADLIFLDINMPRMNGWDFLDEYANLGTELQARSIIIILTTSDSSDDMAKAKTWSTVSAFRTKPLTPQMMLDITEKYF